MQPNPVICKATEIGIGLTAIATLILAGCGGGRGSTAAATATLTANTTSATITPYKGPFAQGATVTIKDANGNFINLVSGGIINASGVANVTYNASVSYPLIVEVTGNYYNEITGQSESTTVPLRSVVATSGVAASVPVTIVTETAVSDLQARLGSFAATHPIQAASAVAALSAAGAMLGIPASAVPAFDAVTNKTSDANTLRLAAWASVANGQTGSTLAAKVHALANSLATLNPASAPTAVISQAAYNSALLTMTSGASSVMAAGATAPTAPAIPTFSYSALYASAVAAAQTASTTCPAGQTLNSLAQCVVSGATGSATSAATVGMQMGGGRIATQLNLSATVSSFPFVSMASCAGGPLDGNVLSSVSGPFFCRPDALTTDGLSLYVVDNWLLQPAYAVIRKIDLITGVTTSIAGSWTWHTFGLGGVSFNVPLGITTDGTSLYLSDTGNHVVRKIDIATNTVTTFAGAVPATVGGAGSFADGAATSARFNKPSGITTDGVSLFIADTLNRAIRKIVIATGVTSTLAGNPTGVSAIADGTGVAATFVSPTAITTDGTSLYVVDSNAVRKVGIASGIVVTMAGSAAAGYADATGAAALFNLPNAIVTDGTNLYLTDNGRVRKLVISSGIVTTLAGGGAGVQADGVGVAASFDSMWLGTFPYGITSDGSRLYVGDRQAIRKIQ